MFAGEHASLNALHTIPSLCPQSFAHGRLADSQGGAFLVTDFLDMRSTSQSSEKGSGMSLAAKLAKLHTTPAPIPEGFSKPVFGFPVPTCCGSTVQENKFTEDWADFYANHRLLFILRQSEMNNGKDGELRRMVERTANKIVPRLLDGDHLNNGNSIQPVVIHGDVCLTSRILRAYADLLRDSCGMETKVGLSLAGKEHLRKSSLTRRRATLTTNMSWAL